MNHTKKPNNLRRAVLTVVAIFTAGLLLLELALLLSGAAGNYLLRHRNPTTSAFIRNFEMRSGKEVHLQWKKLENISSHLVKAVIVAEDDAFFQHEGLDMDEMKASFKTNWRKKKIARGGSTITMQLVKNLYLSSDKNPLRKFNEIILALDMENRVPKRRILEVYLNVVQWGDGIYGAQAASRHYFGKSAGLLSPMESAYLAALLPNPVWLSGKGSRRAERRKAIILRRMSRRKIPYQF